MKFMAGCTCSAILGGLFVLWMTDPAPHTAAVAQDPFQTAQVSPRPTAQAPRRGPELPARGPADSGAGGRRSGAVDQFFQDDERLTEDEAVNVGVYEQTNRSVVNIITKSTRLNAMWLLELEEEGTGSGTVLDRRGHILTNYHVIEEARQIAVTLYDGTTWEATAIGADPVNDLAVLRIDAPEEKLFPVRMGESSGLRVGQKVYAIGNPFGLERTMTTGIISSLNRSLKIRGDRTVRQIIQIDAAVNPGNSGGPLLDSHGRLIGINTAIASRTGQSSGVGFAIPVNLAARVVPQLIRHGRPIRPEIGIQRVYETEKGLLIARLTPDGPAARAGLRGPEIIRRRRGVFILEQIDRSAADLIVAVDGEKVRTADDFLRDIESRKAGERVRLTIIREDRELQVDVVLGSGESPPVPSSKEKTL